MQPTGRMGAGFHVSGTLLDTRRNEGLCGRGLEGLQLICMSLSNSRPWSHNELHMGARVAEHGHQGVHAEPVDLAADQITDAGAESPQIGRPPWLG